MAETRCGYIALLGAPNAGKSTLLNQMVGQKLAIVTPKAQTTRTRITGVCVEGKSQLIFLDVPGIFAAKEQFDKGMVSQAWKAASDADVICFLLDAKRGLDESAELVLARLKDAQKPTVLVLNKVDLVKKPALLALTQACLAKHSFNYTFMISAKTGDGVVDMKAWLAEHVKEGVWLYPEDALTDLPMRLIASEITREKLMLLLQQELPYALAVETEKWEERENGSVAIHQVIYVERENQKKIILGKQGSMIKTVGERARKDMQVQWDRRVHLNLFVKVKENWKSSADVLLSIGMNLG